MEPNWIKQRAYITPNRIGLSFGQESWSFAELNQHSIEIAQQLAANNLCRGDRVAILAPSSPQLIFVLFGCMQAQIEMVLLNSRLTQDELAYQIEDAEVKCILFHESEGDKIKSNKKLAFYELFSSEKVEIDLMSEWDDSFTTTIMYTSGTTGFPKGVRQTLANHKSSALSSALNMGITMNDTWLCTVPIFHISGFSMLMKSLLYGIKIRLYEKFDVEACAQEIASGQVTHMSVVAVTLGRLIEQMEKKQLKAHPHFQLMLAGGGPIPTNYLERAAKLHLSVAQTYGMTETASQTATLSNDEAFKKIGSAGKPLFFNQIQIAGAEKPYDEGEILIKGPHVTPGYIGRFKELQAQVDGWLKSGDIGYLDEDGYLFVVDRRSDLIISGGENIYPAQIENVLLAHPDVLEAGVCGVEDEQWGQVPIAYIISGGEVTEADILDFCKMHLASYKMPKRVIFTKKLPRNGSNKLVRRKLKEIEGN